MIILFYFLGIYSAEDEGFLPSPPQPILDLPRSDNLLIAKPVNGQFSTSPLVTASLSSHNTSAPTSTDSLHSTTPSNSLIIEDANCDNELSVVVVPRRSLIQRAFRKTSSSHKSQDCPAINHQNEDNNTNGDESKCVCRRRRRRIYTLPLSCCLRSPQTLSAYENAY